MSSRRQTLGSEQSKVREGGGTLSGSGGGTEQINNVGDLYCVGWSDNGDGGKCFPYLELESTKNIIVKHWRQIHTFDLLSQFSRLISH